MIRLIAFLGIIRPRCTEMWQRNNVQSLEHWQCTRWKHHPGQHHPWSPFHGHWVGWWVR